jgi:hypothetical protein
MMKKTLTALALALASLPCFAKPNVILVTIDGLRWQEVFQGADKHLIEHKQFVKHADELKAQFWHNDTLVRREKLMPFLWQTVAKQGVLIGDRNAGSLMSVSNDWYFSYPGYNEILTGKADPKIDSNALNHNSNVTYLEWLNEKPRYEQKLAAFGSWNAFPYIYNEQRSGLYVNANDDRYDILPQSSDIALLNELQAETPSPWQEVRQDSFTHRFAIDYLTHIQPQTMVISYGETDDFAHEGHYDRYLQAAHRTDAFLADLWQTIQNTPGYRNNTVMLVVTDHGRGYTEKDWQHHASKQAVLGYMKNLDTFPEGIIGANEIWMAAIGTGIQSLGVLPTAKEVKQDQIAATVLTLLGEDYTLFDAKAGKPIAEILVK